MSLDADSQTQKFTSSSTFSYDYKINDKDYGKVNVVDQPVNYFSYDESIQLCMRKLTKGQNFNIDQNLAKNCAKKILMNLRDFSQFQ